MYSHKTHEIETTSNQYLSTLSSPWRIEYRIKRLSNSAEYAVTNVTCLHEKYILMNLLKQSDTDDIKI